MRASPRRRCTQTARYHPRDSIKKNVSHQYASVDALCHDFTVARQWEQECVVAMLNSPAFAAFKPRTLAADRMTLVLHTPHAEPLCPSTAAGVTAYANYTGDAPIVHWAGCEDSVRRAGAQALAELYPAAAPIAQACL